MLPQDSAAFAYGACIAALHALFQLGLGMDAQRCDLPSAIAVCAPTHVVEIAQYRQRCISRLYRVWCTRCTWQQQCCGQRVHFVVFCKSVCSNFCLHLCLVCEQQQGCEGCCRSRFTNAVDPTQSPMLCIPDVITRLAV
eukprot:GHRR01018190.1.p2 GENE.GHRR01018190.1~~GHRR01018190.1.p2  ORF type:complete len:139 (-),score=21.40 GHRR01018190.1:1225-1641(-)